MEPTLCKLLEMDRPEPEEPVGQDFDDDDE